METAFLKTYFHKQKKNIYRYIFFLRYHGHPDGSMETIYEWKRYSTQNMKPKRGYTKNHTVFDASLVASLSKALPYLDYLKFVSYVLNCRINSAIKNPMASLAWWLKRSVTALRASFILFRFRIECTMFRVLRTSSEEIMKMHFFYIIISC